MSILEEIRIAMKKGEIKPYYQPQYDSVSNKIKSAEALVRWVKEDGTVVPPSAFVPELEKTNAITEIDWFMFEEVCKLLAKQKANGDKCYPVSVNFSRHHVETEDFCKRLSDIADRYNVSHELLEVEVTESAMVSEINHISDWVKSIRDEGFSVAIDDFGSGLSSLSFVKDVAANVLKIDKSLLSQNCENEKERVVLESIFYFANRLNMATVAEGVETREQLGFLQTCDCNKIQGYIFAKPMPEAEYVSACRTNAVIGEGTDILKVQTSASAVNLLMNVIFKKYPLVIFSNLTRNSYYMMAYENYTSRSCPSTGVFDELIVHGAGSMHHDDRQIFSETFGRDNLLKHYYNGDNEVALVTRQLGDDGVYRNVKTVDYFVKSTYSDDVLVISLCENI